MLAPWAMHTHIWYRGDDAGLPASMATLRDAGYDGYWSVEYVSMRYAELGLRLSAVRDILDQWRT
jgi:sugar phosphate isomerase/epimerase